MSKQSNMLSKREYVLVGDEMPFAITEAYKALRTNLMFVLGAKNSKVAMFTSAYMMEGKTTTSANIAITFAQTGAKVLLIDADMRKPRQHRLFECELGTGLSEVLCGVVDDSSIQRTKYENLYLMTAGRIPPNPADLLVSPNMDKMLETVTKTFDYVFIDAPPVGIVTDAAVLAAKIGGTILVVRTGHSRTDGVRRACEALAQAGTSVIGYIMTDAQTRGSSYKKYRGRYKYYSSYRSKGSGESKS